MERVSTDVVKHTRSPVPMHVGRPGLLNRELFLKRVNTVLDGAFYTNNGPFAQELESYVCQRLEVPNCVAVANATLGLELVLTSLELEGEVIVPSFTFVSTVQAIKRTGHNPVFCDIDPVAGGNISARTVERCITDKTSAILAVNLYGNVSDVEGLEALAQRHGLRLIFDSAHGLGVKVDGKSVGGFGDAEVFSLHATKFVQGCEGGLITTRDDSLAKRLKLMRNFGFNGYDSVEMLGTNAKLSELHAAMALTSIEVMDEMIAHNERNFEAFRDNLPTPLTLLEPKSGVESNYQYVVVLAPASVRDALVARMHERNILVRKYFHPGAHKHPPFDKLDCDLPVSEELSARVLCLPTGVTVSVEDATMICRALSEALIEFGLSGQEDSD